MDLLLTKVQIELREEIKRFSAKELAPTAIEVDTKAEFNLDNWKKMADIGLLGLSFPEEFGGRGANFLEVMLAYQGLMLGGAAYGTAACMIPHTGDCGMSLLEMGSEYLQKKYLPKLASGEAVGAFALTEAMAGSDNALLETRAVKKGDSYIINGEKQFITNAPVSNLALVLTWTDKSKGNYKGMSAFIVTDDFPGFSRAPSYSASKMGELASATGGFTFTDCEVPVKNMIGREGDGWEVMRRALYWERAGILGSALGLCEDVLLRSIRFAKKRVAFGKTIGEHQVIKHKLADMKTRLEAARHLVYNLSWEKDSGINNMMSMAITKNVVTESLIQNASEAVQIFGGRGYMREYEVERIFRDARLLTIVGGTAEIQREIIGNRLLRLDLDDIAIETPGKFHQE